MTVKELIQEFKKFNVPDHDTNDLLIKTRNMDGDMIDVSTITLGANYDRNGKKHYFIIVE